MRKIKVVDAVANRYFVSETTSGATSDIYLTDGTITLKLEDCLIWDSESFEDEEFYDIVAHLQEEELTGVHFVEYEGWSIVTEEAA
jgi:hypothetical protein